MKSWSKSQRRLATGLILFHLWAVIAAPLAAPPPVSNLSKSLSYPVKWYQHATYTNHRYRYFNVVGSTSIVRYELIMPDGTSRKERLADHQRIWPRLFYHRHLMLGETIYDAVNMPPEEKFREMVAGEVENVSILRRSGFDRLANKIQADIERNETEYIAARTRRQELLRTAGNYLLRKHGAERIRFFVQKQERVTRQDVETGTKLGSDDLYVEQMVAEFGKAP